VTNRSGIPLGTGKELYEVKPPKEEIRPFSEDKKENPEDEDDGTYSTQSDGPFNNRFAQGFQAISL
jgi:hypothetical protein